MSDKFDSFVAKDVSVNPDLESSVDQDHLSSLPTREDISVNNLPVDQATRDTTEMGGSHGCHKDKNVDSDDQDKAPYPPPSSVKTLCLDEPDKSTPSRERKKNKTQEEKVIRSTKSLEKEKKKEKSQFDSDFVKSSDTAKNIQTTQSKTWEQMSKSVNKEKWLKTSDGRPTCNESHKNTPVTFTEGDRHQVFRPEQDRTGVYPSTKPVDSSEIKRKDREPILLTKAKVVEPAPRPLPLHYTTESILNIADNIDKLHDTNYQYPNVSVSGLYHVTQIESKAEVLCITSSGNTPINIQTCRSAEHEFNKQIQEKPEIHNSENTNSLKETHTRTVDEIMTHQFVPPPDGFQDIENLQYQVRSDARVTEVAVADGRQCQVKDHSENPTVNDAEQEFADDITHRVAHSPEQTESRSVQKKYQPCSTPDTNMEAHPGFEPFSTTEDTFLVEKHSISDLDDVHEQNSGFVGPLTVPEIEDAIRTSPHLDIQSSSNSRTDPVSETYIAKKSTCSTMNSNNHVCPVENICTRRSPGSVDRINSNIASASEKEDCHKRMERTHSDVCHDDEILTDGTDSETFDSLETILASPEIYEKTKHLSSADEASVITDFQLDVREQVLHRTNNYGSSETRNATESQHAVDTFPSDPMDSSREIDDNTINELKEDSLLSHTDTQHETEIKHYPDDHVILNQEVARESESKDDESVVNTTVKPKRGSEIICDVIDAYNSEVSDTTPELKTDNESYEAVVESITKSTQELIKSDEQLVLSLADLDDKIPTIVAVGGDTYDMYERTPTSESLPEMVFDSLHTLSTERRSVTCTESDLDISEHRDDNSSDNMYADDEDDGVGEVLFSRTYTQPGGEVLVSCTLVNTGPQEVDSDGFWGDNEGTGDVFRQIEISADAASCAFVDARKQMQEIHHHLQNLREQMERLHDEMETATISPEPMAVLSSTDSKRGLTD